MPNYGNKPTEAPGLLQDTKEAGKDYKTADAGKVYPVEINRPIADYLKEEGSMGFERNQGAKRDGFSPMEGEVMQMGQHKLQKLSSTGSDAA